MGNNRDRAFDARGLLAMIDFKFVLMLYLRAYFSVQ